MVNCGRMYHISRDLHFRGRKERTDWWILWSVTGVHLEDWSLQIV